ncbi:hypothetical protein FOZ63_030330 [Perkinsus olseni]|uniref:Uncharacterized protein n=1 Tax=Perkinsus olseni TaxID=32597 RepID=A0A7J6S947_PEROL|nr:hypothetical protein FOZ63_030330 [Perkinsus olseni]
MRDLVKMRGTWCFFGTQEWKYPLSDGHLEKPLKDRILSMDHPVTQELNDLCAEGSLYYLLDFQPTESDDGQTKTGYYTASVGNGSLTVEISHEGHDIRGMPSGNYAFEFAPLLHNLAGFLYPAGLEPELVFAKGGVVYGIFKCASSIALQQIYPLGQKVTLVSTSPCNVYYFAPDTGHLYVLNGTGSLLDYDVEASNVHATWELPKLFSGGMQPSHMVVIGNELFVAVSREYRMEVRCTKLDEVGDIEVLWAKARSDDSSHIYCLSPVSAGPLSVNILYHEASTTYSVTLEKCIGFRAAGLDRWVKYIPLEHRQRPVFSREHPPEGKCSTCRAHTTGMSNGTYRTSPKGMD